MKIMNELPGNVRARILNALEHENLESVHMGCGSPLEDDNTSFIAIAHERDPETPDCYSLNIYDSEGHKLLCYDGLTYADALVCMGNYINY